MEFPTDWDVEKYYDETEPELHWEMRKEFMEVNKDKYPEDYLVALAKTFSNMEFMGCVYNPELMARVSAMSEDIVKKYREMKKTKLQRTFVTASSAAENKAKRKSDPGTYTSYTADRKRRN